MNTVLVYGATGHTGRFVVTELLRRGFAPIVSGRSESRLATHWPDLPAHPASVDDPRALDRALAATSAVINCAGPFAVTAAPIIEAAIRADIPYVDVAAEIEANASTFSRFSDAPIPVVPAMAFYGALGDLLATTALGDWPSADEAHIAYGLTSWHPTPGTLLAGQVSHQRRAGRRVRFTRGVLQYHDDNLVEQDWHFPAPLGPHPVLAEFTMADVVTIPSHLQIPEVRTYMTVTAAQDLANPSTTPRESTGDPNQSFIVDVRLRRGPSERQATASGQDIYAVTAPLAAEAVNRLLTNRFHTTGAASPATMFDPPDFLKSLSPWLDVKV